LIDGDVVGLTGSLKSLVIAAIYESLYAAVLARWWCQISVAAGRSTLAATNLVLPMLPPGLEYPMSREV